MYAELLQINSIINFLHTIIVCLGMKNLINLCNSAMTCFKGAFIIDTILKVFTLLFLSFSFCRWSGTCFYKIWWNRWERLEFELLLSGRKWPVPQLTHTLENQLHWKLASRSEKHEELSWVQMNCLERTAISMMEFMQRE